MPQIPPRNPVADRFSGVVLQYATAVLLATSPIDRTETIASGDFVVRYAIRYMEKPHLAIVPGLLAVDYGDFFNGDEMWDFIHNKINTYPRAEVFGYRNDGEDDMTVLKKLDMEQPKQVLVYTTDNDVKPIAAINAIIAATDTPFATRMLEHLPRYDTLDDWINRE